MLKKGFGRIEVEPIAAIKELIDINPMPLCLVQIYLPREQSAL